MKKYIIIAAAAIVALGSCAKENAIESPANKADGLVFTATLEQSIYTKTTLTSDKKVNWESTDKISINGITYTATPKPDATKADFTKDSGGDPTATFKAYYPAGIWNGTAGTLPATQTYAAGKISNLPMYAESSTTSLNFKNLCAVLAITVPGTQLSSVSNIEVSSNCQMNGDFTATAEGVLAFDSKTLEAADKKVTLSVSPAKSISSSETFYIAIPAGTHCLTIKVSDGTVTKAMATKVAAGVSVSRNTIYPITFAENTVQLWAGGPYFATMNLGETEVTGSECYYEWTATGSGDAAATVWGDAWRVPTEEQMNELFNVAGEDGSSYISCEYTDSPGVYGFLFKGITSGYTDNSLFLPAENDKADLGSANYLSGSVEDSECISLYLSYILGSLSSEKSAQDMEDYEGLVRPVLK